MKQRFPILLAGSFALNLSLAALVWFDLHSSRSEPRTALARAAEPAPSLVAKPEGEIDPDVWPSLFGRDLPTDVGRMQTAGFPADIIRAILSAQLQDNFAAKRRALDADSANRPFWRSRSSDPKVMLALKELSREQETAERNQDRAVRDLLGADVDPEADDPWSQVFQSRQFAGVPPGKIAQLRELNRSYEEQRAEVNNGGSPTAADRVKFAAIDQAQQSALAQLLTPSELNEYQLRNSPAASNLRDRLTALNPTEQEFRALFPLERAFDERFPETEGRLSPEEQEARDQAEHQLDTELKGALTPQRAVEFERAADYSYQQTSQLVTRLELPPEAASQVYDLEKEIEQRSQTLSRDRTLSNDQRTQQRAALAEEAKTKITSTLGARGFEAYRQYGGQWLQQLQPRPAPSPR